MKAPIFIAALAGAYLLFVAIVVLNYEAGPEDLDWDKREIHNLQVISALHLGQEKHQVVKLLGNADFSEAKPGVQGDMVVLFYRTRRAHADGQTTRDECTPLLFQNNRLIAWGHDTYQQYLTQPWALQQSADISHKL
ncbi:DUF3192 domain-containing protein [Shewanella sp. NFH-SH190041]|uniref:DUF3192 domain-containing protein n=1 Tax=Shewanella sp. NFH-SH190041 TaxID=2950245 RepID=UPI0021C40F17|nr:DUF3192 domain-containing protein [Shewanella sp. NFH-SH190041]BDM65221.1 DUF3192 domain-containing protein [Shewanella sp. NFH-SH190041]